MAQLACNKRDKSVKVKKLRRDGFVPCIVYGRHLENDIQIQVKLKSLEKLKGDASKGSQIELLIDEEPINTMIKAIDYAPMTNKIQHVDFQVLTSGERIKTSVPIHFIGKDDVKEEGNIQENLTSLDYEVLPKDILDGLDVDVSGLTIGHDIKVEDLPIMSDERFHVLTSPNTVVASLAPIQEVVLETDDTAQVAEEAEDEAAEE